MSGNPLELLREISNVLGLVQDPADIQGRINELIALEEELAQLQAAIGPLRNLTAYENKIQDREVVVARAAHKLDNERREIIDNANSQAGQILSAAREEMQAAEHHQRALNGREAVLVKAEGDKDLTALRKNLLGWQKSLATAQKKIDGDVKKLSAKHERLVAIEEQGKHQLADQARRIKTLEAELKDRPAALDDVA